MSPTTHAGPLDTPPAVPASRSKIPPRHIVPRESSTPRLKSAGLIAHVFDPKLSVTVTVVEQASKTQGSQDGK